MQPCAVCGGIGVDANGYCVNCRTYRGVAGRPVASDYDQANGEPYYRTSSYPTYPTQQQPQQPQQTYPSGSQNEVSSPYSSGAHPTYPGQGSQPQQPAYPAATPYPQQSYPSTSGYPVPPEQPSNQLAFPAARPSTGPAYSGGGADSGEYRGYRPQESEERSGGRGKLTLIVLVLVLGIAGGAYYLLRDRNSEQPSLVDKCVVGSWTVTSMTMDILTDAFGTVRFTSGGSVGNVGKVDYRADGTAVHTYGDQAKLTADVTMAGVQRKVVLKIAGDASYDYRTENSTMTFANNKSNRKVSLTVDGTSMTKELDVEIGVKPARYNCEGESLTIFTDDYRAEAHRD